MPKSINTNKTTRQRDRYYHVYRLFRKTSSSSPAGRSVGRLDDLRDFSGAPGGFLDPRPSEAISLSIKPAKLSPPPPPPPPSVYILRADFAVVARVLRSEHDPFRLGRRPQYYSALLLPPAFARDRVASSSVGSREQRRGKSRWGGVGYRRLKRRPKQPCRRRTIISRGGRARICPRARRFRDACLRERSRGQRNDQRSRHILTYAC